MKNRLLLVAAVLGLLMFHAPSQMYAASMLGTNPTLTCETGADPFPTNGCRIVTLPWTAENNSTVNVLNVWRPGQLGPDFMINTFDCSGRVCTELMLGNGSGPGNQMSLVYMHQGEITWNAESNDTDHTWRGHSTGTKPVYKIDAGTSQAAFGGNPGNAEAMLELYARDRRVLQKGAGTLVPILDSGVGSQVDVTGQSGPVVLNRFRGLGVSSSAPGTTIPMLTTVVVEKPNVGSAYGYFPAVQDLAAFGVDGPMWMTFNGITYFVELGDAESCGTGYRCLRVGN